MSIFSRLYNVHAQIIEINYLLLTNVTRFICFCFFYVCNFFSSLALISSFGFVVVILPFERILSWTTFIGIHE